MINKFSTKVSDRLLRMGVINEQDYEIYQYGLEHLFTSILDLLTLFAIGLIMGMIWQGIIFVLSFMLFRKYAGGYHTHTPLRCYLLTNIVILGVLSVMKYIEISIYIYLGLYIVSSIIIFIFSPVEAINKKLDEVEKIIYRKKTIIIWSMETILALLVLVLRCHEISICIFVANIILCVSLLLGHIENNFVKQKHLQKSNDVN